MKLALAVVVTAILATGGVLGWHRIQDAYAQTMGTPSAGADRVLVVVMSSRANVEAVRVGLGTDALAYDSPDAVALPSGKILASRIEAAGDALNAMGWVDRPLEIMDPAQGALPSFAGSGYSSSSGSGGTMSSSAMRLARLAKKKTLTPGEALEALELLK